MSKEAMKLALEALCKMIPCDDVCDCSGQRAIAALREALAEQPAQQEDRCPGCRKGGVCRTPKCGRLKLPADHPYRTEQPAQQQEPVAWMWRCKPYCGWPKWSVSLKRPADSGRDGHKRTEGYEDMPLYTFPQPAQQEPVAWLHPANSTCVTTDPTAYARGIPLYTSPPAQRKPLTDEEIEKVWRRVQANDFHDCVQPFARAIEAAHGIKGDA